MAFVKVQAQQNPGLLAWTDKTGGTHSELDCTRKLVWGNQPALWSTTELAHVRARLPTALTGRSRHSRIIPPCWLAERVGRHVLAASGRADLLGGRDRAVKTITHA